MAVATLGGQTFRLAPSSIQWSFSVKTSVTKTYGGRVVQVLGAHLGDLNVRGSFGVGGWREQREFLKAIKGQTNQQIKDAASKGGDKAVHFRYKDWDFVVSLLAFNQVGESGAVRWNPEAVNVEWSLRLFIEEDNSGITKIAQDAYISRFAAGLGWKQTEYNGPMTQGEVEAVLAGQDPGSYLAQHYGVAIPDAPQPTAANNLPGGYFARDVTQ